MTAYLTAHPAVKQALYGALSGWAAAARTDYTAFRSFQSLHDAMQYQWGIAMWRWFQGAVTGALGGSALGAMLG